MIIAQIIHLLFLSYTVMILIRIVGSWFPQFASSTIMRFVSHYTDPYLNLFRRFIPPIGGTLDLSPLIAFIALRIAERIILALLPL